MLLAKATNLDTGEQSKAFVICADCYGNLDDAFGYANAEAGTDIALCEVEAAVEGLCEQCGREKD